MTRPAGTTSARAGASRRAGWSATALCGVQFVDVMGGTVVITALPRMLRDVGGGPGAGVAVVTAYAVFFGGLLMVAARAGDRVGHRRAVLAALGLFCVASGIGALAQSVWMLTLARALQGTAAAVSVPSALRLLTTVVPEGPLRRRAVAGWSAAGAAAGASGFVVGGLFTELASWRTVFWVYIAIAAVLAGSITRLVDRDPPRTSIEPVGWRSAGLLTVAAMGIAAGTTLLGGRPSALAGGVVTAAGCLAAVAFVRSERRATHPLVPPAAWRSPLLTWGAFGSFANTATTSSSITVATLYLQDELGLTALGTAGVLVGFSLLVVVGSVTAPGVIRAGGWGRALALGLGAVAVANGLLVAWPQVAGVGVAAGLSGLGIGVASVAATEMGTTVEEALKGTAAGVVNTAAQLGTAIGTAAVLLVATLLDPRAAWVVVAVLATLAAAVAASRAPTGERRAAAPRIAAR